MGYFMKYIFWVNVSSDYVLTVYLDEQSARNNVKDGFLICAYAVPVELPQLAPLSPRQ